ncbi:hypothetical protein TNCV_2735991 [Trichonephila clavipes]|nr:hypothetical protein TNCV_2735991 [Trichonephila clavipes]
MSSPDLCNLMPGIMCNLWKQFQDTGSIERKPGQGLSKATSAREDRHWSRRNRGATASLVTCTQARVSRVS